MFYPLADKIDKDMLPADKLKYEKERLTTVLEHHASADFKPIGNIRKSFKTRKLLHSSERKSTEASVFNKKSHSTSPKNKEETPSNSEILNIDKNIVVRSAGKNSSEPNIVKKYNESKWENAGSDDR